MEEELKEIIHKSHPDYTHDAAQCSYCQIVLLPDLLAFISAYGEAQAQAQRERDAGIAHKRATEWDAVKHAHDDDGITYAQADARYHEACDIAALIRDPSLTGG